MLREKKETGDLGTTQLIEDAVSALDPAPAGHFTSLPVPTLRGYESTPAVRRGWRLRFGGPPSGLGPPNPCTDADRHRRGRRCVRYLLDRLLSSVLNHTPGPCSVLPNAAV